MGEISNDVVTELWEKEKFRPMDFENHWATYLTDEDGNISQHDKGKNIGKNINLNYLTDCVAWNCRLILDYIIKNIEANPECLDQGLGDKKKIWGKHKKALEITKTAKSLTFTQPTGFTKTL